MVRPNVILVITDDQGYADLGCTGNPWIHTPHLDRFHDESVRLTDFHVSPLCTPTRGSLMSGHRPIRNGAWATEWGRAILRADEMTMPDAFAATGYRTGMFGKWHLGDNYPYRPEDRGFQHVVAHKGGGVGGTADFWANNYFDDTYYHNGKPIPHTGYCTDVWFSEAMKFIDLCGDEPFFAYIATNAPHSPYLVADHYAQRYRDNPNIAFPPFYGMITNIDENFGLLDKFLAKRDLTDNTVVIFMTDNGTSGGCRLNEHQFVTRGYNAGMRGMKGSYYDGGHRVPLFIRWPAAGVTGGRDIDEMALDIDLLPTLIDLCGLRPSQEVGFDGMSLSPLLRGEVEQFSSNRVHFIQYRQSTTPPEKWVNAVMTRRWRLIGGSELYDIKADPSQQRDVAADHPGVVSRLRDGHEQWWAEVSSQIGVYCPISLGHAAENPTRLDACDVMGDVAWNQCHVAMAVKSTGRWTVQVEHPGHYRFSLRRWPEELDLPIDESLSIDQARELAPYRTITECLAIHPIAAQLKLLDVEHEVPVGGKAKQVTFELDLDRTVKTELEAWFVDGDDGRQGAYYVYVERL